MINSSTIYFIAFLGIILGAFVNWAIDRFAWTPRFRSPWRKFPPNVSLFLQRRFMDYIPIFGWVSMIRFNRILFPKKNISRETSNSQTLKKRSKFRSFENKSSDSNNKLIPDLQIAGMEHSCFWFRPLLIECGLSLFLVWFYQYKMATLGTSLNFEENHSLQTEILFSFLTQTFLIVLMLIASFIDFDDYIIPDVVIIPGTVLGILFMTFCFHSELLFNAKLNLISILDRPERAAVLFGTSKAFWIMLACWTFWTFALLDRRWYSKLPGKQRFFIFLRSLKRSLLTPILFALWVLGILFIFWISSPCWNLSKELNSEWNLASQTIIEESATPVQSNQIEKTTFSDPASFLTNSQSVALNREMSLFHSMIGLTIGMLLIWSVRLMGHWILKREAMGFGDVTLLGMIGVFVGWRGAIVVFFLAPFAGLLFGLFRLFFRTEREIPYGPFLCLATLAVLTESSVLEFVSPLFIDSETLLLISGIAAFLFLILLLLLQGIKRLLS